MATPEQVLQQVRQAKGQVKQSANTQGTRGAPRRGGVAARPVPKVTGPPTTQRFPGFKPRPGMPFAVTGGPALAGGQGLTARPMPGSAGSAGLRSLSGREPNVAPDKPMVEPGGPPADLQAKIAGLPPQIQAAIKTRGLETVMANRAGLAGRLGMPGAPAAPGPGGPDQAVSDAATNAALGLPAAPAGPRPLPPGAEPGGRGVTMPGGGFGAGGMPILDAQQAQAVQQATGAGPIARTFPGFKPRPGGMGGMAPGVPGGLTARPMPGTVAAPVADAAAAYTGRPGGLGQTISDPADQVGGGFGDVARTASGLMARRRLVGAMEPGQMER